MKKTPRRKTLSKAKDDVWEVFAPFIKVRDCLRTTGSREYGECITCNYSGHISTLQAGHFVSRVYNSTLFDERNVHSQCPKCNGLRQGEQYTHGKEIDKLYGEGTADELMLKKWQIKKYTIPELEELKEYYQTK